MIQTRFGQISVDQLRPGRVFKYADTKEMRRCVDLPVETYFMVKTPPNMAHAKVVERDGKTFIEQAVRVFQFAWDPKRQEAVRMGPSFDKILQFTDKGKHAAYSLIPEDKVRVRKSDGDILSLRVPEPHISRRALIATTGITDTVTT